jgi:hypothetical protein
MSERDFEIGGRKFKLSKIDAFKQFHIVRRIAPLLSDLLPAMKDIQKVQTHAESMSEEQKLDEFAKIAAPLMTGLAKLSDEDSNRVLFGLLESVEMQQLEHGNWMRLAQNQMLMAQNLELPILLQVAGRAFMYNLSGFFAALPHRT